jgi:hypothetical protein
MTERRIEDLEALLDEKAAQGEKHITDTQESFRQGLSQNLDRSVARQRESVILPVGSALIPGVDHGRPSADSALLITAYQDADGNQFFTATPARTRTSTPELRDLRDKIVAQRGAFEALDGSQRAQIRSQFASSHEPPSVAQPYREHLRSEAIGLQFQRAKK